MEKFEKLSQLLPFGSIFILLCSSIKLVIYYKIFNIQIVDYIGIQEFITSFIDDLLIYICLFGVGIFLYLFDFYQNGNDTFLKNDSPEEYKTERRITLTLSIIILVLIIVSVQYSNSKSKSAEIICVGLFIFLATFRIFLSSTKLVLPYPIFIISGIIMYTIMYGYTDAHKIIENNNNNLSYTIVFKEKTYSTDKYLKYIGKTENFLFFYNLKSKRTTVLKSDDLIKISIK